MDVVDFMPLGDVTKRVKCLLLLLLLLLLDYYCKLKETETAWRYMPVKHACTEQWRGGRGKAAAPRRSEHVSGAERSGSRTLKNTVEREPRGAAAHNPLKPNN